MVSLPELKSYSQADHNYLDKLSPIYSRYRQILDKKTPTFNLEIRRERQKYWLQSAYATFLNSAETEEICRFWSEKANDIILKSWQHCQLHEMPVSLFAFGKLGSMELNLSSDIDVVFVNSEIDTTKEVSQSLRQWIKLLNDSDENGFVFRVDTSIRPGGETSPLAPDVDQFISYYGYLGEAWNRISFVRMRAMAGDKQAIKDIEKFCESYSYPRHLDYSIVNSIKNLRTRIRKDIQLPKEGINIKMAPGGIREIELYLQSLQVIYGGRKKELRQSSMSSTIDNLMKFNIIPPEEGQFFKDFYWQLRNIENHIQGLEDQHTYHLDDKIIDLVQKFSSQKELQDNFEKSEQYISNFFNEDQQGYSDLQQKLTSQQISEKSQKAIQEIIELKSSSLKKASVEKQKKKLLHDFLEITEQVSIDKDLAILSFKDFIFSIKSKSSIFYMLNKKTDLLEHLVWLFSFSPYIGQILCSRPELLDSFVLGSVEIQDEGEDIDLLLDDLLDYKLLTQMISASHFLKTTDVWAFCSQLSSNTDYIAKTLLNYLTKKLQSEKVDILRLGKWGGGELGIHSDLDFVFVTDKAPGKNELQVARRFINLVSSPFKGGKLFNIDLRLKPNEQAGPLIVSKDQLESFILGPSEAWQKQAYLKSHYLHSGEYFYKNLKSPLSISKDEVSSLRTILEKLLKPKKPKFIDIKYNRGGLVHSEFHFQIGVLEQAIIPHSGSTKALFDSTPGIETEAWENYSFMRTFEQLYGLCTDLSSPRVGKNHPALIRIQRVLKREHAYDHLETILNKQTHLLI